MTVSTLPAIVDDYSTTTLLEIEVSSLRTSVLDYEQYEHDIIGKFSNLINDTTDVYVRILSIVEELNQKQPECLHFDDESDFDDEPEPSDSKRDSYSDSNMGCANSVGTQNVDSSIDKLKKHCTKVFRKITSKCHPDKTSSTRLHAIYKEAYTAREQLNLELLNQLLLSIKIPRNSLYALKQEYLHKQKARLNSLKTEQRSRRFYQYYMLDNAPTVAGETILEIERILVEENTRLHNEFLGVTIAINIVRAQDRGGNRYNPFNFFNLGD